MSLEIAIVTLGVAYCKDGRGSESDVTPKLSFLGRVGFCRGKYAIIETEYGRVQIEVSICWRVGGSSANRPGNVREWRTRDAIFPFAQIVVIWRASPDATMVWLRRLTNKAR